MTDECIKKRMIASDLVLIKIEARLKSHEDFPTHSPEEVLHQIREIIIDSGHFCR